MQPLRPLHSILVPAALAVAGAWVAPVHGAEVAAATIAPAIGTSDPAQRTRLALFTSEEIARARAEFEAEQERRLSRRNVDPALPYVELAPFVVEGDNSLLLAAIRRETELGPASIRRRVAELAPMLSRRAALSARASQTFFSEPTPGGPADRGSIGLVSWPRLQQAWREPLVQVFAAPGTP